MNARTWPHSRTKGVSAAVTVTALVGASFALVPAAHAAPAVSYVVNDLSMDASSADTAPGDGSCATAADTCTLLAALQEANAAAAGDTITIGFADDLGTGSIDMSAGFNQRMNTESLATLWAGTFGTAGAYFEVDSASAVVIDFDDRISLEANDLDVAGILITSDNVTIKNSPNNRAGGAAYVVRGAGASLENLTVSDPSSTQTEVGVGIMTGAADLTITGFTANSVWHAGVAVGIGETVDGLTIDGYTVTNDGGDDTVPVYFAQQDAGTTGAAVSNVVIRNAVFQNTSEDAAVYLQGPGLIVDGLTIENSTFANTVNGFSGLRVDPGATLRNAVVQGNTFTTPGQIGVLATGAATIEGLEITGNTAEGTAELFSTDNYAGSISDVVISGNTVTDTVASGGAVYVRSAIDGLTIRENTFDGIQAQTGLWIGHDDAGGQAMVDVLIEDNTIQDLTGTTMEGVYLQGSATNGVVRGNTFVQTPEHLADNENYDHNWAIRTAAAPGWDIIENSIDGHGLRNVTEAPIRVETSGTTTVVGNTFGTRTNGTTVAAESEAGAKWFLWNVGSSNARIQTLRAEDATFTGSQVTFTAEQVDPEAGNTAPTGSEFTVHVYWTAADHAEEYLGAVAGVSPGDTVSVATDHTDGFIRLQTVDASGNVSQYSALAEPVANVTAPLFGSCDAPMTFDTDNEGWRVASVKDGVTIFTDPVPVPWTNDKGNPAGSVTSDDLNAQWTELWTPEFSTNGIDSDLSDLAGKTIGFDYLAQGADFDLYFGLVSADGDFFWYVFKPQVTADEWVRIEVPLDPTAEGWHTAFSTNGPTGAAPTEEAFAAALANADRLVISMEGVVGQDRTWVDNIGVDCDDTPTPVTPAAPVIEDATEDEVTGTGEPEATVTVRDSSGNVIGAATVDANGQWIITGDVPCGETLTATQQVGDGPVSPTAEPYTTDACAVTPPASESEQGTTPTPGTAQQSTNELVTTGGVALQWGLGAALALAAVGAGMLLLPRRRRG